MADELDDLEPHYVEGEGDPKGFSRTMFKIRHVVGKSLKWGAIGAIGGAIGLAGVGLYASLALMGMGISLVGPILAIAGVVLAPVIAGVSALAGPVVAGGVALALGLGGTGGAAGLAYMGLTSIVPVVGAVLAAGAIIGGISGLILGGTFAASSAQEEADAAAEEIHGKIAQRQVRQQQVDAVKMQRRKQEIEMKKQALAMGISMEQNVGLPSMPMGPLGKSLRPARG